MCSFSPVGLQKSVSFKEFYLLYEYHKKCANGICYNLNVIKHKNTIISMQYFLQSAIHSYIIKYVYCTIQYLSYM